MEDVYERIEELIDKELDKIAVKGDITPAELESATKAVCLLEKIKMLRGIESSSYMDETSYMREPRMRRDSYRSNRHYRDGSYSDGGYSGHSVRDRMISHLESTMMDEASSESERKAIRELIDRLYVGD